MNQPVAVHEINGVRRPCARPGVHIREDGGGLLRRDADGQLTRAELRAAAVIGGIDEL